MGNVKMQKVDLCVIQDNELAQVFLKTEKKPAVKTVVVIDQIVPPNSPKVSALHKALREKAEKENIPCYYGKGMCGKLLADGLLKAGERAVTCDKAAGAAGAIGAQVTCADPTQLKQVLETGELLLEEPENGTLKETVKLTGKLPEGLSAKDLALNLVKELGTEKLTGKLLSLTGDSLDDMELSEKMVLCGVLEKAGATAVTVEKEAEEKTDVVFDVAQTKELTALPGGYKEFAALEELPVTDVKSVFIGGTTGGNLKDLETVSSMLKGRKIAYGLRLVVAPSDADTYIKAATAGYITDILEAGGIVINHCGNPEVQGRIGKTEVMVSNDLENKPGYAGFDTSKTYLTSTKAAVEAALLGTLGYKEETPVTEEEETENHSLTFEGRCWKFGNDIDTDIIIPTQHLNYETMDEIKVHAFEPLRPELAAKLREGDLIVAGNNFGCGSSREHAPVAIKACGVPVIIAASFARIFYRNGINVGLPLMEIGDNVERIHAGDKLSVDLSSGKIRDITTGETFQATPLPGFIQDIAKAGGLIQYIKEYR